MSRPKAIWSVVCPFCRRADYVTISNYDRTHYYIRCGNRKCDAQGPTRKTAGSALRAWRWGRYLPC